MVDDCTVSRGLENLSERELLTVIRVVAQDLHFRHDLYGQIKRREAETRRFGEKHAGEQKAACSFCALPFHFFRRAVFCEECGRHVCRKCVQQGGEAGENLDPVCPVCASERALKHQWIEWSIICPYSHSQFGLCKLIVNDGDAAQHVDWMMRAKIELHAIHQLDRQIDDAWVNFVIVDGTLESARQKLIIALLEYSTASSHYAYIDDAIVDVRRILSKRWNCIQTCELRVEAVSYVHLLANAIVATIIKISKAANRRDSLSMRKRSMMLPPLLDVDFDESVTLSNNWFMKAPFSSPRGSMRSQCASKLINSITTPQLFTYGVEQPTEIEFDSVDDLLEAANTPTSGSFLGEALLRIHIEKKTAVARNGELVRILARAETDDEHDVEMVWYNGRGELKKGGRILITRRGMTSVLEIFDVGPEQTGQLVCMAIGPISIASDAAFLQVSDEDVAGEEPIFVDPLHVLNITQGGLHGYDNCGTAVNLKCRVSGFPEPYVTFHYQNRQITPSRRHQIDHVDDCWMLRISECSLADEGNYAAVASSRVGRAISRVRLSVLSFAKTSNA